MAHKGNSLLPKKETGIYNSEIIGRGVAESQGLLLLSLDTKKKSELQILGRGIISAYSSKWKASPPSEKKKKKIEDRHFFPLV